MRREFKLAQSSGRNIVPVREESVDLTEMAKTCPDCMQAAFGLQMANLRHNSFDADVAAPMQSFIAAHQAPMDKPSKTPAAL